MTAPSGCPHHCQCQCADAPAATALPVGLLKFTKLTDDSESLSLNFVKLVGLETSFKLTQLVELRNAAKIDCTVQARNKSQAKHGHTPKLVPPQFTSTAQARNNE